MKLSTSAFACLPLLALVTACTAETASDPAPVPADPAAESTTSATPGETADPENVGETSEALVCGITCKYAGTCSVLKPNKQQYHGYFYKCTPLSQCGGSSYYTDCGPSHGSSYCAFYGGC